MPRNVWGIPTEDALEPLARPLSKQQWNPLGVPTQDLLTPVDPRRRRNSYQNVNRQRLAEATAVDPWQPQIPPPVPAPPPPVPVPTASESPPAADSPPPVPGPADSGPATPSGLRVQWRDEFGYPRNPTDVIPELRQQGMSPEAAERLAYEKYEAMHGRGQPVAPPPAAPPPPSSPPPPAQRQQNDIPMRDIDYARTAKFLERQGYPPVLARFLAPYYWQVLKGRTPSPETMLLFQPQLPTEIQRGRTRVVFQPPGMQAAALQAWNAQEAQAQREAEWLRELLNTQRELALRRIAADDALRRQAIVGAAGPVEAGVQGLQQHPSVSAPTSPYDALGGTGRMGAIAQQQRQRNPQAFLQFLQQLQGVPDDVKQQLLAAFQTWWGT